MRESRTYGSVRGALSNERPYRDDAASSSRSSAARAGASIGTLTVRGNLTMTASASYLVEVA